MNIGVVFGAIFGAGAVLVFLWTKDRKMTLAKRVDPYLRVPEPGHTAADSFAPTGPLGAIGLFFLPWYRDLMRALQRLSGRNDALRERLERAGSMRTPTEFRSQQVLWGAGGLVVGLALAVPLLVTGRVPAPVAFLVALMFPVCGALARDWLLSQAITRREAALATQLPTITELLALAVGAGEAPLAALERVTARTQGELSLELRRTVADVHAGTSMDGALKQLARRSQVPSVVRFADAIGVAIERGTPLAQVLHDQARDAREEARRKLMEISGRKEIAMLVPVVFFILPITVLFAIYPGLTALRGGL